MFFCLMRSVALSSCRCERLHPIQSASWLISNARRSSAATAAGMTSSRRRGTTNSRRSITRCCATSVSGRRAMACGGTSSSGGRGATIGRVRSGSGTPRSKAGSGWCGTCSTTAGRAGWRSSDPTSSAALRISLGAAADWLGPGGHYTPLNEISFLSWAAGRLAISSLSAATALRSGSASVAARQSPRGAPSAPRTRSPRSTPANR